MEKDFIFQKEPTKRKPKHSELVLSDRLVPFRQLEIGDVFMTPYTQMRYRKVDDKRMIILNTEILGYGDNFNLCKVILDE